MRSILRLCAALAAVIEEFAASGGVQLLVEQWRANATEATARARLADERRHESALARGDADALDAGMHRLLAAAARADRDRAAARGGRGPAIGDRHDHDVAMDRHSATVESLQRQIDDLTS